MILSCLLVSLHLTCDVFAQTESSPPSSSSSLQLPDFKTLPSSIPLSDGDLPPTGSDVSYISYTTTSSVNASITDFAAIIANANATLFSSSASTSTRTSSSTSLTLLQGTFDPSSPTASLNGTNSTARSATSSSSAPTNTQPCNNYPELCSRRYSDITFVAAHNSPFVNPNNAAANQALPVTDQLNDGIRMLQGQTHFNSTTNTISYCHTSCNLLNAGTAQDYFTDVVRWVRRHPYDVITILIGNSDLIGVGNYTIPLVNSGLSRYAYTPPVVPMSVSSWPTLEQMILTQKRVVIFMDYEANQTQVPYILDEFSQMWETPFSPTDRTFPCTAERPPDLAREDAEARLYIANHNLNTEVTIAGTSLLIPTTTLLNETNAVEGFGSLGLMANDCNAMWSKPPNFLMVDFYNEGNFPGSVFAVAAQHNNVTYNRPCCGVVPSAAFLIRPQWTLGLSIGALSMLISVVI